MKYEQVRRTEEERSRDGAEHHLRCDRVERRSDVERVALHAWLGLKEDVGTVVQFRVVAYNENGAIFGGNVPNAGGVGRWGFGSTSNDDLQPPEIDFTEESTMLRRVARETVIGVPIGGYLSVGRAKFACGSSDVAVEAAYPTVPTFMR